MTQRISSPLFVGRATELAAFDRLVDRTTHGAGSALLIAGEAGIGKSRLVAEIEARVRRADGLVLVGECVEVAEGELAFSPIVAALRALMTPTGAVAQLEPPLRRALAGLWPSLGESGDSTREQLFEAVYRVLAEVARRCLVVLVIEDLHWIDRSSRDLLGFLVRTARRDRILVVGTYRPDELHRGHPLSPFLAELQRSGQAQRFELQPLGQAELADQLGAIAGGRPPAATVEQIFARSEGNPFFAEELLASADAGPAEDLPGSLREALLLRLERLAPATQEVLRAAAVVGRSVDHRLLAHVTTVNEADLHAALREATEHHVLVLTARGVAYTFRHALLREAIYDDTFPGERLGLHRLIAEALGASPELATTGAAAELAYHWYAAGGLPAALRASLDAAAEADRMHAHDEALRHLERVLEMWDRVPDADQTTGVGRVDILLQACEMAERGGHAERALALGQRAREAVDPRLDPLLAAAAETRIGRALWMAGRGDDAIEHLASARQLVPPHPPSVQRAEVLAEEGRMLMLASHSQDAHELLEEALELATQLAVPRVQASALNSMAITYGRFGEIERAIASGRRGREIAQEAGDVHETERGYVNGSQALDDAGRVQEALEVGLEGIDAARRLGMDRSGGDQLRVQAAWRLVRMGRMGEAERVIAPSLEAATTPFNVAASKSIAGYLAAERADFPRAERLLSEAWALMQRSGGFQLIGPALAWMVSLHLWRDELDRAQNLCSTGLRRVTQGEPELMYNAELYWLAVRTQAERVVRGLDEPTEAESRSRSILADLDRGIAQIPGHGPPPEALAFRALAQAEFSRRLGESDPALWRAAGDRFAELDAAHRVAYTQFRAAEALAEGAAPSEVAELVRMAHTTAVALGTRPFENQVEEFARARGIGLVGQAGPGAEAPVREGAGTEDVLKLLTDGRRGRRPDRLLATVMFTDIVGSTALASDLGDRQWRDVLDRHDELVRAELERFGGVPVKFIGDGTLSTFDGPGRAIECARALCVAVKPLGIQIRAGVHTGEIELRETDIGGIAVHIAARVAALAAPSEILVSKTVIDVVAGSGLRFEDRGEHSLKGMPGSWHLSAVAGAEL